MSRITSSEEREQKRLLERLETWIGANTAIVEIAQRLAAYLMEHRLINAHRALPFQIVPVNAEQTDFLTSVYIDHPVYGTALIHVNSPDHITFQFFDDWWYPFENTMESEFAATVFINQLLQGEYEEYRMMHDAAQSRDITLVNALFNRMLEDYHAVVDRELEAVKAYLEARKDWIALRNEKAVWKGEEYVPVNKISGRIDLALLAQPCPFLHLKQDEAGEALMEVDEEKTDALRALLAGFFKTEGRAAALLYAAQKAVAEQNYKVEVVTDSSEQESDRTAYLPQDEDGSYIPLYVLHATRIVAHSPLEVLSNNPFGQKGVLLR